VKRFIVFAVVLIATFTLAENAHARGCSISEFTMTPNPPYTLGTHVQLYVKSNCGTVRFEINGKPKAEIGSSEQRETWKTEEFGSGTHTVCAVARGEGGWENADRRCRDVYVSGGQGPTSGGPSRCYVTSFVVTPDSGPIGTKFNLASQGQCDGNMRAARYTINGSGFGEHSNNTYSTNWNSSGYAAGKYTICYLVTAGDWNAAASSCVQVTLTQGGTTSWGAAQGQTTDQQGQTDNTNSGGSTQGPSTVVDSSCQGNPISLSSGDTAQVTPGPPNNLRRNSSTSSSIIGSIPGGGRFSVVGGPKCQDGYWWWQITYNGVTGWTAQGNGSQLWIQRVGNQNSGQQTATGPQGNNNANPVVTVNLRYPAFNREYNFQFNTETCYIENGSEIVANELSRFSFWISGFSGSGANAAAAGYFFPSVSGAAGKIDVFRVWVENQLANRSANCSAEDIRYQVGEKFMDTSGLGNIIFGYFMEKYSESTEDFIADWDQKARDGDWDKKDNPDDLTQRRTGRAIAMSLGHSASVSPLQVEQAAKKNNLR